MLQNERTTRSIHLKFERPRSNSLPPAGNREAKTVPGNILPGLPDTSSRKPPTRDEPARPTRPSLETLNIRLNRLGWRSDQSVVDCVSLFFWSENARKRTAHNITQHHGSIRVCMYMPNKHHDANNAPKR